MAFNYSFTVCTTTGSEIKRFVATWVGEGTRIDSVTSVEETTLYQTAAYGLYLKFFNNAGVLIKYRQAQYSLSGKIYFSANGSDFKTGDFPLSYAIGAGTTDYITGTISDECGSSGGGGGGGGGGGQTNPLPPTPNVPETPCLPPQPAAPETPPVSTPCVSVSGTPGPKGFG